MLQVDHSRMRREPPPDRIRELAERPVAGRPLLITLVDSATRSLIDTGAIGGFERAHAASVREGISLLSRQRNCVLIVSPMIARTSSAPELHDLLAATPGVVAVAALVPIDTEGANDLLVLGSCGIRQAIDLSTAAGWKRLRDAIERAASPTRAAILEILLDTLCDATVSTQEFFVHLVSAAPRTDTVRQLAAGIGLLPSTLMSRFFRSRLPSPKQYLVMCRLAYASALFENQHASVRHVANDLGYSSPQALGRHIRETIGLTATEFRQRFSFDVTMHHFVERLIVPYRKELRTFVPIGARGR